MARMTGSGVEWAYCVDRWRAAYSGAEVDVGKGCADLLPAGPELGLPRQRKGVLCHVGGAEADEAYQLLLLRGRWRSPRILQIPRQSDRRDVVAGAG